MAEIQQTKRWWLKSTRSVALQRLGSRTAFWTRAEFTREHFNFWNRSYFQENYVLAEFPLQKAYLSASW